MIRKSAAVAGPVPSGGAAILWTTAAGLVGAPSRAEPTSIHHCSPFVASNSKTSVSAAGKKLPAMSQGSVIRCGLAGPLGSESRPAAAAGFAATVSCG
jgi:hypothetical protein